MSYSPETARLYSQLGISGTTYEPSYNEMQKILNDLKGQTVLDFGTGTGRSARLLKNLGAQRVIGVDKNPNMILQAKKQHGNDIDFYLMSSIIPLPDDSVDVAISAHVLIECNTKQEMVEACKEISRVMKQDGLFVMITTNPNSIGNDYISYRYLPKENLVSGNKVTCHIKGDEGFEIEDTYWTKNDYHETLQQSGFVVEKSSLPLAEGTNWLDETRVAPDIVFICKKL